MYFCKLMHELNKKWWVDIETEKPIQRNVGEMIALIHSELSEALEGHRKNLMDDKLKHRKCIEVELADAVIRIADMAEGLGLDLAGALYEKTLFNSTRIDHTLEHRRGVHGKKI
jgi:hypothetical protein